MIQWSPLQRRVTIGDDRSPALVRCQASVTVTHSAGARREEHYDTLQSFVYLQATVSQSLGKRPKPLASSSGVTALECPLSNIFTAGRSQMTMATPNTKHSHQPFKLYWHGEWKLGSMFAYTHLFFSFGYISVIAPLRIKYVTATPLPSLQRKTLLLPRNRFSIIVSFAIYYHRWLVATQISFQLFRQTLPLAPHFFSCTVSRRLHLAARPLFQDL